MTTPLYPAPVGLWATDATQQQIEGLARAVAAGAVATFPGDPATRLASSGDLTRDEIEALPLLRAVQARLPHFLKLNACVWPDGSALVDAVARRER